MVDALLTHCQSYRPEYGTLHHLSHTVLICCLYETCEAQCHVHFCCLRYTVEFSKGKR